MYALNGLYGRHSRSLGLPPQVTEAPKNPLDITTSNAYAAAAAAAATPGEQALPIDVVQRAMAVHYGAAAMRHSCGTGVCDGRWGPGTERMLDQVFMLLHIPLDVTFEVKGSMVLLPNTVAAWVTTKAREYRPSSSAPAGTPDLEDAMIPAPLEEPYVSERRRGGPNVWLIVGASTAAVGVLALGFVAWKKRGKR